MRITRGYKSDQVEDRRGQRFAGGGGGLGGGGLNLLGWLFKRFGIAGVLVGGALLYFMGGFGGSDGAGSGLSGPAAAPTTAAELAAEQPMVELVSFVFDDAQRTWSELFSREGQQYQLAKLVLFRDRTQSSCGVGQAAMGPFYCPADQRVYIDLGFYEELRKRFGAPGDFAQAYVIAHEVGHHVQHLLGTERKVRAASEREQAGANGLLVRLELQADCYAGMWAHGTQRRDLLEAGDLEEAMRAANVIGDDALQKQATGVVRPESFTHGSSAQRARWFKRGFENGRPGDCDTFAASSL
jgi:predicted metalloprotease